ncbi:MAG: thioredoxin family protein [Candidatus Mcinerneyibacterium aminivorans]|uniref:Thioredoxin family protein n=1 Tax=Candidatus Mcinerneyibacterium aminivorans TaxID=2703815 RepID=A0A5D0MJJ1_9BACT|nr:MAG: thioredoxin family protein [Candidatus Mcinerneyibacterium aminivorans]
MNKNKLRIELLLASPPTAKCQKLLNLVKNIKQEIDKKVKLDVYYAGSSNNINPTEGYKKAVRSKRIRIPASFINGEKFSEKKIPKKEDFINKISQY